MYMYMCMYVYVYVYVCLSVGITDVESKGHSKDVFFGRGLDVVGDVVYLRLFALPTHNTIHTDMHTGIHRGTQMGLCKHADG